MVMFIVIFIACTNKPVENTVSIVDYRKSKAPEVMPESHKDKDVDIFRTMMIGETYAAVMYRIDHGQLRGYRGDISSESNYPKASYSWINDSTISVKLFDSAGQVKKSFSLIGYGSTTSLEY
jgi:hypothetical protein